MEAVHLTPRADVAMCLRLFVPTFAAYAVVGFYSP